MTMNVREMLNQLGFASGDHDADVRAALVELALLRTMADDADRWRMVKPGLFIAARDKQTGEIEVVYQSGSMDEVATAVRPTLTQHPTEPVFDIEPVIDEARRRYHAGLDPYDRSRKHSDA